MASPWHRLVERRSRLIALALFVVAACRAPSEHPKPLMPGVLIVLAGAEAVTYFNDADGAVTYRLDVPHPALETIQAIRARLEPVGWTPTEDDFLNPGLNNSHALEVSASYMTAATFNRNRATSPRRQ
jgi:hypothetical protein